MIKKDRIYVEDLRVKGTIGIFDWEKKIKQEISLSYEIEIGRASCRERV